MHTNKQALYRQSWVPKNSWINKESIQNWAETQNFSLSFQFGFSNMGDGSKLECSFFCSLLLILTLQLQLQNGKVSGECDFFTGSWILDQSYPIYKPDTCPFIRNEFSCQKNGRPDSIYTHYRWQPHACNLARFPISIRSVSALLPKMLSK